MQHFCKAALRSLLIGNFPCAVPVHRIAPYSANQVIDYTWVHCKANSTAIELCARLELSSRGMSVNLPAFPVVKARYTKLIIREMQPFDVPGVSSQ